MLDAQTLSTIAYLQGQVEDLQRQKTVVEAQLMDAVAGKAQLASQINLVRAAFDDQQSGALQELQLLRATYSELKLQHERCLASSRRLTQQHTAAMQRCQQLERSLKAAELENTDLSHRLAETKRSLEASTVQVTTLSTDLQLLQEALLANACMSTASAYPASHHPTPTSNPLASDHSSSSSSNSQSLSDAENPDQPSSSASDNDSNSPLADANRGRKAPYPPAPTPNAARLEAILLALIGPTLTSSLLSGAQVDPLDILKAVKSCASRIKDPPSATPADAPPPHDYPTAAPRNPHPSAAGDGTARTVFVTKLARHVTDDMLGRVFSAFGPVERSEMARRGHGSANRNFAWVRFSHADDAEAALRFFGSGELHAARFGELLGRSSGERVVVKRTQRELGPHGGIEPPPPSTSGAPAVPPLPPASGATLGNPNSIAHSHAMLASAANGVTGCLPLSSSAAYAMATGGMPLPLSMSMAAVAAASAAPAATIAPDATASLRTMARGYDGYMMSLAEGSGWPAAYQAPDAANLLSSLASLNSAYPSQFAAPGGPGGALAPRVPPKAPGLTPPNLADLDVSWLNSVTGGVTSIAPSVPPQNPSMTLPVPPAHLRLAGANAPYPSPLSALPGASHILQQQPFPSQFAALALNQPASSQAAPWDLSAMTRLSHQAMSGPMLHLPSSTGA